MSIPYQSSHPERGAQASGAHRHHRSHRLGTHHRPHIHHSIRYPRRAMCPGHSPGAASTGLTASGGRHTLRLDVRSVN